MNDSIVEGLADSLHMCKVYSHVTISNSSWGTYGSVILGAVLTFLILWSYNHIKDQKKERVDRARLLREIRERFLDADKYAAEVLQTRMMFDNSEPYVNEFAKKIGNIEFFIESKSLEISSSVYGIAKKIKDQMFQYQQNAMKSTFYKGIAIRNQPALNIYYSRKSQDSSKQCALLRKTWQVNLDMLDFEIKKAISP